MQSNNTTSKNQIGGIAIFTMLFRSHMLIAAIGFSSLVVSMAVTLALRTAAFHYADVSGPSAREAAIALAGTQNTVASLRGWVTLKDTRFKDERRLAWRDEVEPAMASLTELSKKWTDREDVARLEEVKKSLIDLQKSQWWIEDIAASPGNTPARLIATTDLRDTSQEISSSLSVLIDIEKTLRKSPDKLAVLNELNCARYHFSEAHRSINEYVTSGVDATLSDFRYHIESTCFDVSKVSDQQNQLTSSQKTHLAIVNAALLAFQRLANEIVEIRNSSEANVALDLLLRDAIPKSQKVISLLTEIFESQEQVMKADTKRLASHESLVVILWSSLIIIMVVSAAYLSWRYSRSISLPISQLSRATTSLADGEATTQLADSIICEVRELTNSFREMNTRVTDSIQSLLETRRKFQLTVDASPTAMVSVNERGEIVLANREAERLFGYSAGELVGQLIEVLVPQSVRAKHPSLRDKFFANPSTHEMGRGRDLQGVRKDGSSVSVEVGLSPIHTSDGVVVVTSIVDITNRKKMEGEMRAANQQLGHSNQELEQFAYVASHDLQEPLRKISSYCQLLKEEEGANLSKDGLEYIDVAIRGAERLRILVRDLLKFWRINTRGKTPELVNTNECLKAALDNLEVVIEESGAKVKFSSFPRVMADSSHLILLFQNLIGNALKYRGDVAPIIEIGGQHVGDQFEFYVSDNGIGIEQKFFDRIFAIFQRLHTRDEYSGTGIGLALCKRIVQRCGGKIWVESSHGDGSTFYFTLNLQPAEDIKNELLDSNAHSLATN